MFAWHKKYNTGILKIDDQHRLIVDCINELTHEQAIFKHPSMIEQLLETLDDYILTHLTEEEELMKEIGYPDLEEHKEKHAFFIAKFEELKLLITEDNKPISGNIKLLTFLSDWFLDHIQVEDQKYVPYTLNNSKI